MKKATIVAGLTVAAASALLLTGCHANFVGAGPAAPVASHSAHVTAPVTPAARSTTPATAVTTPAPTVSQPGSQSSTIVAPPASKAQPVRATRPLQPSDPTESSNAVAGLTTAIAHATHPGLGLCDGSYSSLVAATGDLRGIGGVQYLVDTTCQGATGSSPDEVAIYQSVSGVMARTAVLSTPTAGQPAPTAYPYLDGLHTVVLTYDFGAEYRLDEIRATSIVVGSIQKS